MTLKRRHAYALFALAAWNVFIWVRFIFALTGDHSGRPTAYFVAHGVLIAVNLLIALALIIWGVKILRAVGGAATPDPSR